MEMVFNNSLWRRPRSAMAGMSPQELAVPSCSTDVRAEQEPSEALTAPPAAQPHKHSPCSRGRQGRKGKVWIHEPSCSSGMRVRHREARGCSQRCGQRSCKAPHGSCKGFPAQPAPPGVALAVGERLLRLCVRGEIRHSQHWFLCHLLCSWRGAGWALLWHGHFVCVGSRRRLRGPTNTTHVQE